MDDIEALKKQLEETHLAYQMTAQISQFKSGFLAQTAHELRSPLSSLMGLHQLILADLCESHEEEREFIAQGYQAAHKLLEIIDQITMVAKLDYGKIPLNIEIISLQQTVNQIYHLTQLQAINYNYQIETNLSDIDTNIQADQSRLIQSLVLLIDTGITLMKRGKIIISTLSNSSDKVARILIDIPCSLNDWHQESERLEISQLNLTILKQWSQAIDLSPQMKLLLSQTLLNKMGGQLTLIEIPSENQSEPLTQVQCLIPLAVNQESHLPTK